MGHRAVVAYRRGADAFRLHYAHWGSELADRIRPETPFGGPTATGGAAGTPDVNPAQGRERVGSTPGGPTQVDPSPLAHRADADGVLASLDASIEWLVVVSPSYDVTTYLVCPLAVVPARESEPELVLVRPAGHPVALRRLVVAVKSWLAAARTRGFLTRETAREALRATLASHGTVRSAGDPSFLRGGR